MAIICPTEDALSLLGIEAIALKDVPAGKAYTVIDSSEIPENRTDWRLDAKKFKDGKGADYGVGSDNVVVGWTKDAKPIIVDREGIEQ